MVLKPLLGILKSNNILTEVLAKKTNEDRVLLVPDKSSYLPWICRFYNITQTAILNSSISTLIRVLIRILNGSLVF